LPWFVLNTHPKKEFVAQQNCTNQGFNTFLPTYIDPLPKKGDITKPLFPSYLFVQFDPTRDRWYPLMHTIGVKRLFSTNPLINKKSKEYGYVTPIPVPDKMIKTLQQQILNPEKQSKTPIINPGAIVRITTGPFEDHKGICSWSDSKRIKLLMDIMHGQVEVTFSYNDVELV
jgi:transcriptional antiterminator RfaH